MNVYEVSEILELAEELKGSRVKYFAVKEEFEELSVYKYIATTGKIRKFKSIKCVDIYKIFSLIKM